MDTLLSIRVFCAVAELKSFTAAAERLNLSPAMTSKHVAHLEKRVSARLLNRTSRHVSLTENGALYFDQARALVEGLDEVEAAVSREAVAPRGTLRLSAPVWMANAPFVHIMAEYQARYPDVHLDVDLSGRLVHLLHEGFDVALRISREPGEGLIARKLADVSFHLVASPAYLERAGRPRVAEELNGHAFLAYSLLLTDPEAPAVIAEAAGAARVVPVLRSGNENLLHLATLEGMGLAYLPDWLAQPDIEAGRLKLVLADKVNFTAPLLAVYPSRKHLSAKVRTFVDFLAEDRRLSTAPERAAPQRSACES